MKDYKLKVLESTVSKLGDPLTKDQLKIIETALNNIEHELVYQRKKIVLKINFFNLKKSKNNKEVNNISYSLLSIQHIKNKLGI